MNSLARSASEPATPPAPGLTSQVMRVLEEYLAQLEGGAAPRPEELLAEHPELAEPLQAYLASLDFLHKAAIQLRSSASAAAKSGEAAPPVLGQLGDFRIVSEIGRGGMGVVYEAEQLSLHRQVALKVLPFAAALDTKQLQRFKNEAQAAGRLHHTSIVPVYAVGSDNGVHYYAMQFIDGQNVATVIADLRKQLGLAAVDPARSTGSNVSLADDLLSGRLDPASDQPTTHYAPPAEEPLVSASPPQLAAPSSSADRPPATAHSTVVGLATEHSVRKPGFFRTIAGLGAQAADALEHAHQKGIIHRDIKPANLLVSESVRGRGESARGWEGESAKTGAATLSRSGALTLWITDFGLAHFQSDSGLTMTGDVLGTVRYMSPEQARGRRGIDQRTDIYSLGATLYELLTLEPVFKSKDRHQLLQQITTEEPVAPRRINKSIPAELETIVLKCLEKDPQRRYACAAALADDLRRWLAGEPITARPEGRLRRAWRAIRRHRRKVMIGLAVALPPLLVLLYMYVLRPSPEQLEARRQQEALEQIQRDLAAGRKVTLIGETGRPRYLRWLTEEKPGKLQIAEDGAFVVQDWENGLVELIPDPQCERYRFSAEIRHEEGFDSGRVGLFFFHSEQRTPDTRVNSYCTLAFNDRVEDTARPPNKPPVGNSVFLQVRCQTSGMTSHGYLVGNLSDRFTPALFWANPRPWRKLAVEVRPEYIRVFWDGKLQQINRSDKLVPTVAREELIRMADFRIKRLGDERLVPAGLAPRDGFGLFVFRGIASFRFVEIEPLYEQN